MSSVVISGDTSGSITLSAPAVAGTNTITLPASTGNAVIDTATQTLTNKTLTSPTITGAVVSAMASSVITSGTAVASTSGTSIDFTSIPSWVKRITIMLDAVSTSGTSNWLFQLGDSGGIETTGYLSVGTYLGSVTGGSNYTTGFGLPVGGATHVEQGFITLCNLNGNVWTANGSFAGSGGAAGFIYSTAGAKTLSATLDRVRITTVAGTDTFDAGSINILYE